MPASAVVDLRDSFGAAFAGVLVSNMYVLCPCLVDHLLSWRVPSLLGVTLSQLY
jgi:hypothetical protein